jgi:polysaccharide chain length determinant protein (PEP-CTERM system associated)
MNDVYQQLLGYAASLWRKRWYIALVGWVLCIPGWFGVVALPDRYESAARVYVDTDNLLSPLLRGISVEGNVGQQVDFMQRTLLSRPNVDKLMRMTDLDLLAKTQVDKDELYKDIAKRVAITQNQGRNLFSVSFVDKTPEVAQRVVQSLLSIFVESNVGASRTDIEKARQFLDVQIAQYEKQLQASEARLAEYKKSHLDILSRGGQGASFQQSLEAAQAARTDTKGKLDDMISRRDSLKKQLAQTPQFLSVDQAPQVVVQNNGEKALPPELKSIQTRIDDQQKSIDTLASRFTEQHPDLRQARKQLAELQAQYAEVEKKLKAGGTGGNDGSGVTTKPVKSSVPNQVYDQTASKLIDAESAISTLERQLEVADEQTKRFEQLASTAPLVEAELSTLNRDYGVIRKNYDELIARREAAKLADAVETTGEKIQFRIVDPPQIPSLPSGPPRLILMSAVLFGSLAIGVVVAFLMAQLDDTFISIGMLRQNIGLPVLGSVSRILTPGDRRLRILRTALFAASIGGLVIGYGAIAIKLLRDMPIAFS